MPSYDDYYLKYLPESVREKLQAANKPPMSPWLIKYFQQNPEEWAKYQATTGGQQSSAPKSEAGQGSQAATQQSQVPANSPIVSATNPAAMTHCLVSKSASPVPGHRKGLRGARRGALIFRMRERGYSTGTSRPTSDDR